MGHQTDNGKKSSPDDSGAPPGDGATPESPPLLSGLVTEPYVPRVFAFDPSVSAEVRDPAADGLTVAAAEGPGPAPADPGPAATDGPAPAPVDHALAPIPIIGSGVRAPGEPARHSETPSESTSDPDLAIPRVGDAEATPVEPSANPASAGRLPERRSALSGMRAQAVELPAGGEDPDPDQAPTTAWARPEQASTPLGADEELDETGELPADIVTALASMETTAPQHGGDRAPHAVGSPAIPQSTGAFPDVPNDHVPPDALAAARSKRRRARSIIWSGAAVVVLGGLFTGAQWFVSDKVARGTTVDGVQIGGLSTEQAVQTLTTELGARASEPITLAAGDGTATFDPTSAGLSIDAAATVGTLTGFTMNPVQLWQHVAGGSDVNVAITIDDKAFAAEIDAVAPALGTEPVDGTVQFADGAPTATPAEDGTTIDKAKAKVQISKAWLRTTEPITVATTTREPAITQEETDAALDTGKTVVSAPVTVAVGGQSAELPTDVLASAGAFVANHGTLELAFDPAVLTEAIVARTTNLLKPSDDAHFEFVNGVPSIVDGTPGTVIDPGALSAAVATAATGQDRTASVEIIQSDPAQSIAALEELGIKEVISEFSTPLTNDTIRTKNLQRGAERISGTLLKPGDRFSLGSVIGPVTPANGYHAATVISGGMHIDGIGGGLSQVSTTMYNGAYFAGVKIDEFQPHSVWFDRYPPGRESTFYEGSIDMAFTNDTPHGILIRAWVGGGKMNVQFWSTKYFSVTVSDPVKSGFTSPGTVTKNDPKCQPSGAGNSGFTVTNHRKVTDPNGKVVRDESTTWTYKPDNAVSCAGNS